MKSRMITAVVATALIFGFFAMNASALGWGHLGILKARFARGEISLEEYQRMKEN